MSFLMLMTIFSFLLELGVSPVAGATLGGF
jgi:hypothetical protein